MAVGTEGTAPAHHSTSERIPPLTEAYRKAHKSYVLVAGLLASWELIGITLDTKDKWGIELKSPIAVPMVLLTLVVYSAYKLTIEWLQCDKDRREHPAAKVDHYAAHVIAAIAISIFIAQSLWHIQIADVLVRNTTQNSFYLGLSVALLVAFGRRSRQHWRQTSGWQLRRISDMATVAVLFLVAVTMALLTLKSGVGHFAVACILGGAAGVSVEVVRVTWSTYAMREPWRREGRRAPAKPQSPTST